MTTTIGIRLLTERKRLGLKQSDVISQAGIGKAMIHRYENDLVVPTTKSVQALKALGFDMDYVLTGTDPKEPLTSQSPLAIASTIEQQINSTDLTSAQTIRLHLLTKTEVGQKILADFLYITQQGCLDPLESSARFFVQFEKITEFVLVGLSHPLPASTPDTANTAQTIMLSPEQVEQAVSLINGFVFTAISPSHPISLADLTDIFYVSIRQLHTQVSNQPTKDHHSPVETGSSPSVLTLDSGDLSHSAPPTHPQEPAKQVPETQDGSLPFPLS